MPPSQITPYDIAAIPYAPWVPGLGSWLTVIGCAVAVALFGMLRALIARRRTKTETMVEALLQDLAKVLTTSEPLCAERSVMLAKRLASMLGHPECAHLSPIELRAHSAQLSDSSWQSVFSHLADADESLYHPDTELRLTRTSEHIEAVIGALRTIVSHRRGT